MYRNFPHGVRDARLNEGKLLAKCMRENGLHREKIEESYETKLRKMIPPQIIAFKYSMKVLKQFDVFLDVTLACNVYKISANEHQIKAWKHLRFFIQFV